MLKRYCRFVSHHPYTVLVVLFLLILFAAYQATRVKNESSSNRDFLPEGLPVMEAFTLLEDSFGGSESAMVAIELDPSYQRSDEPRDVRDPDVLTYIDVLHQLLERTDDVTSVSSAASVVRLLNDDVLPKTKREILNITKDDPLAAQYISSDGQMALIKLQLSDSYDENELVAELDAAIASLPRPPGVMANPAGEPVTGPVVSRALGPDQAKTGQYSLIAIIIILIIMMRSVRYAVTPLSVIVVGIVFTFGYLGLRGLSITPTTSGVLSMIMGIGIDFGIQVVVRYRDELKAAGPRRAMEATMCAVLLPMATTTVAALIGFKAMGLGQLTFIEELGTYMAYGVTACFLVAITLLPALLVVSERAIARFNQWRSRT